MYIYSAAGAGTKEGWEKKLRIRYVHLSRFKSSMCTQQRVTLMVDSGFNLDPMYPFKLYSFKHIWRL